MTIEDDAEWNRFVEAAKHFPPRLSWVGVLNENESGAVGGGGWVGGRGKRLEGRGKPLEGLGKRLEDLGKGLQNLGKRLQVSEKQLEKPL